MALHASLKELRNAIIKAEAYHKNELIGLQITDLRQWNSFSGDNTKVKRKKFWINEYLTRCFCYVT
jgi:hypothetical protein